MNELDDQVLIKRFLSDRSDDAMRTLIDRYAALVYNVCRRRILHKELAEDATQTVFVALCQKAPTLVRRKSLAGWLFLCADGVSKNAVRKEAARSRLQASLAVNGESVKEVADGLAYVLDDALNELNSIDREVVILRFLQDHSFSQIGDSLSISEDAARMRVQRALGRLRTELSKLGLTADTAALVLAIPKTVHPVPADLIETLSRLDPVATPTISSVAIPKGAIHLMTPNTILATASGIAVLIVGGKALATRKEAEFSAATKIIVPLSSLPRAVRSNASKEVERFVQTFTGSWTMDTKVEGFGQKTTKDDGAVVMVQYDSSKRKLNVEGPESEARNLLPRYSWDTDISAGSVNVLPDGTARFRSQKSKQGSTVLVFSELTKGLNGSLVITYDKDKVVLDSSSELSFDPKTGATLKKPIAGRMTWTFRRTKVAP